MSSETHKKLEEAIVEHLAAEFGEDQPVLTDWVLGYSYLHGAADESTFSTSYVTNLGGGPSAAIGLVEMTRLNILDGFGFGAGA